LRATQKVFALKLSGRPVTIDVMLDARLSGDFVGDDVMLNQILMNLIGNADKFTEAGSIEIWARIVEEDDCQCLIEFRVSDTGVGIDEDKQELIFRKFRQINPQGHKYKGTGLGLAITKELIELQAGSIRVQSRVGQGSTFIVRIPYTRATVADAPDTRHKGPSATGKLAIGHLLVVEDNLMNQTYIGSLLTKWKIPFTLAANGKQAVEEAKKQRFDIILMDIQMPIMDGYEATVAIRSAHNPNQHVPIIALTASAMLSNKSVAIEVGMNDFLTKPFEPAQLMSMLERYAPAQPMGQTVPSNGMTELPAVAELTDDCPPSVLTSDRFRNVERLDRKRLRDLYGTDAAYAADMFSTFLNDVVPELLQLPTVCHSPDRNQLTALAHKLRPTLGMVGLTQLETQLHTLEKDLLIDIHNPTVTQRCRTLTDQLTALLPDLQSELQSLTAGQPV
ncbi:MAG: response regulator, partial [Spirosoma sp.]|nr:response regulator [Spirosoma sp.]